MKNSSKSSASTGTDLVLSAGDVVLRRLDDATTNLLFIVVDVHGKTCSVLPVAYYEELEGFVEVTNCWYVHEPDFVLRAER